MSTGYACSRCKRFISASRAEKAAASLDFVVPNEIAERARIRGDLVEARSYTLCPQCRYQLALWIETTAPDGVEE